MQRGNIYHAAWACRCSREYSIKHVNLTLFFVQTNKKSDFYAKMTVKISLIGLGIRLATYIGVIAVELIN